MRSAGLSIEFLSEYVRLFKEGDTTLEKRRTLLIEQRRLLRDKMEEMQTTLDRLDRKVERYDSLVLDKEKQLKTEQKIDIELLG